MKFRGIALIQAIGVITWALCLPGAVNAVPMFKYDTKYQLSGGIEVRDGLGDGSSWELTADSFLFYDSAAAELTINAGTTLQLRPTESDKSDNGNQGRTLDGKFDFLLGEANPTNGAVEINDIVAFNDNGKLVFDYHEDAMRKSGMTQIGVFSLDYVYGENQNAGQNLIFSTGANPFIFVDDNRLVFQGWWGVWDGPSKIDTVPRFYLTEVSTTPPNEIPEPFTMGLLVTGVLGAAAVRRCHRSS